VTVAAHFAPGRPDCFHDPAGPVADRIFSRTPSPARASPRRPVHALRLRPARHTRPLSRMRHARARRPPGMMHGEVCVFVAHRALQILRRRLFTLFAILSLLLCLATIVMWKRSHAVSDNWTRYEDGEVTTDFVSFAGRI